MTGRLEEEERRGVGIRQVAGPDDADALTGAVAHRLRVPASPRLSLQVLLEKILEQGSVLGRKVAQRRGGGATERDVAARKLRRPTCAAMLRCYRVLDALYYAVSNDLLCFTLDGGQAML